MPRIHRCQLGGPANPTSIRTLSRRIVGDVTLLVRFLFRPIKTSRISHRPFARMSVERIACLTRKYPLSKFGHQHWGSSCRQGCWMIPTLYHRRRVLQTQSAYREEQGGTAMDYRLTRRQFLFATGASASVSLINSPVSLLEATAVEI